MRTKVLVVGRDASVAPEVEAIAAHGYEPVFVAPPQDEWWSANVLAGARELNADFDMVIAELTSDAAAQVVLALADVYGRPAVIYLPDRLSRGRLIRSAIDAAAAVVVRSEEARASIAARWPEKPVLLAWPEETDRTLAAFLDEIAVPVRPAPDPLPHELPRASVVIPVRNGAYYLPALLAALDRQTVGKSAFEVVIADDGSSDGLLDGIAYDHELVRVSPGPPTTEFAARNRGVKEARSGVIAFCDVDTVPADDWLEQGLRALENADVAAGAVRFSVPPDRTLWTVLDVETTKDQRQHLLIGHAETVNLFVRREMFEAVGGFKTEFHYFSDFAFLRSCLAHGARVAFAERAVVSHPTADRAGPSLKKLFRVGVAYGEHQAEDGRSPNAFRLSAWLPVVPVRRWRRRNGLPAGLNQAWFAANGIQLTRSERVLGVAAIYGLVPYTLLPAQVLGWTRRRLQMRA